MNNLICPKCKYTNLLSARFCQFCGSPLGTSHAYRSDPPIPAGQNQTANFSINAQGSNLIINSGSDSKIDQNITNIDTQINNISARTCPHCQYTIPIPPQSFVKKLSNSEGLIKNASAPILIVTATNVETKAILEVFYAGASLNRRTIRDSTYFDLGIHGKVPVFLVQSEAGAATPAGAIITITTAIMDLHPQAVIMGGIAYGLLPNKQQLGDILISKKILCYEPQKVDLKRGEIPRGDRVTVSRRLLNRFRSCDIDWKGAQRHFGLILTGEKLINDKTFRDHLLKFEPEAIGGEMESGGLYVSAHAAKVDWIMVKGICDWADGRKNDDAQKLAADNAAQFIFYVINKEGWVKTPKNDEFNPEILTCPNCGAELDN